MMINHQKSPKISQHCHLFNLQHSIVYSPTYLPFPQDLIRAAKEITLATTKAVAAGNTAKQDDIAAAGNMGRKAINDMLATCKGAALNADNDALKIKVWQLLFLRAKIVKRVLFCVLCRALRL